MSIYTLAPYYSAYADYARAWIGAHIGGYKMSIGAMVRHGAVGLVAMVISANCANSRVNPANYVPVIGHERQATLTKGDVTMIQDNAVKQYQDLLKTDLKQNYSGLEAQLQQSYDKYQNR